MGTEEGTWWDEYQVSLDYLFKFFEYQISYLLNDRDGWIMGHIELRLAGL